MKSHLRTMVRVLAEVDRKIKEAESLTVAKGDDEILQRASKVLAELKQRQRFIQARLREK